VAVNSSTASSISVKVDSSKTPTAGNRWRIWSAARMPSVVWARGHPDVYDGHVGLVFLDRPQQ